MTFVPIKVMMMDNTTTITVKGMVCNRCIMIIKEALKKGGILLKSVELGKIEVFKTPGFSAESLNEAITCLGFEILVDKQAKLVETVKEIVDRSLEVNKYATFKFSSIISDRTHSSYDTVSSVFSSREGITLEHYIIGRKIEKVKSLLKTTDLSLTEISYQANYSSVHHLSKQFKSVAGMNPSIYRQQYATK